HHSCPCLAPDVPLGRASCAFLLALWRSADIFVAVSVRGLCCAAQAASRTRRDGRMLARGRARDPGGRSPGDGFSLFSLTAAAQRSYALSSQSAGRPPLFSKRRKVRAPYGRGAG